MTWRRELNHLESRGHSISEADPRLSVDGKRTCRSPDHRFDVLGPGPPVLDLCEMIPREAQRHRDLKTLVNKPFHYSTTPQKTRKYCACSGTFFQVGDRRSSDSAVSI